MGNQTAEGDQELWHKDTEFAQGQGYLPWKFIHISPGDPGMAGHAEITPRALPGDVSKHLFDQQIWLAKGTLVSPLCMKQRIKGEGFN